ncbi:MAG: tryptophan--tRNA ligase [Terracidiphilus sp.]
MTRIVSGIQPTGELHIGNYLGALRHWVLLQSEAECFFMVADLHAITMPKNRTELRDRTSDTAAVLLAVGIDPERSVFFLQSRVPQHAELAWVLNCFTTVGELRRMVQFKDKSARGGESEATAALFAYPVLQAADILLYQADRVPIGEDQRQHLELTRTLAQRFNTRYPGTFTIPEPLIAPEGARIMDLHDPRKKMSKSAKSPVGLIRLTDSPEVIRSKISAATTDSGCEIRSSAEKPGISNLIAMYSIVSGTSLEDTQKTFSGKTYAQFKNALADRLVDYMRPVRERYEQLRQEHAYVEGLLARGSARAAAVAEQTRTAVFERIGIGM